MRGFLLELCYLVAVGAWLWAAARGRRRTGEVALWQGGALSVAVTLLRPDIAGGPNAVLPGLVAGSFFGASRWAGRVWRALGGLALAAAGTSEFYRTTPHGFTMAALFVTVLSGFALVAAALVRSAAAEAWGWRVSAPALGALALAGASGAGLVATSEQTWLFPLLAAGALGFGWLAARDAGPHRTALCDALAGLGVAGLGFAFDERVLIVLGALAAGCAAAAFAAAGEGERAGIDLPPA